MEKTIKKICECCKKEFDAKLREHNRGNAKFCSMDCFKNYKKILYDKKPKYCKHCDKKIEFKNRENDFCNHSCAAIFTNKERNDSGWVMSAESKQKISTWANYNIKIATVKLTIKCGFCKKDFIPKKKTNKFCCRYCFHKGKVYKRKTQNMLFNYDNYRADCRFKFNINNFLTEFDFELVNHYGWYRASNTDVKSVGVTRDHMVSVQWGFNNNINPKIISHPANCQLLTNIDNCRKNAKCSISYEELISRIIIWNLKYGINWAKW